MPSNLPIYTASVPQSLYVESLGGPASMRQFLSRFPETVYSHAIDSHLYNLLYVLVGPAGAGFLRKQYLEARLQIEEANVSGGDLDSLYSSPFLFARLAEETYDIDAESSLLPVAQRQQILAYDASFRNRAQEWLAAIRAGGTPLGIQLAASSGLSQPVDVVENYKFLYDQFADIPLGITYQGQSLSLNEIVLLPRNDVLQSTQQTFSFIGNPRAGFFTISVPLGVEYAQTSGTVSGTSWENMTMIVSDPAQYSQGSYLTFFHSGEQYHAEVGATIDFGVPGVSPPLIALNAPTYAQDATVPPALTYGGVESDGIALNPNLVFLGVCETVPIAYNANSAQVQNALQALITVGGPLNVACSGGPLPDQPINIVFTGALSNMTINEITINFSGDVSGLGSTPDFPVMSGPLPISAELYLDIAGSDFDNALQQFAPGDIQTMLNAVDILRPQTSFITTTIGQSVTQRQPATNTFAATNYTEVLSYVTGDSAVPWPNVDGQTNWVLAGQEAEAPTPGSTFGSNYVNFHNIVNATAYHDGALSDAHYRDPQNSDFAPWYVPYWDIHTGPFNQFQQALYPFLQQYSNAQTFEFSPSFSINPQPNRPLITDVIGDQIGILNNSYPAQYLGLPGVQQQGLQTGLFYSSSERTSGTDYIEYDLGSVQAVNYVYFEATAKPFSISVAYDVMDQTIDGQANRIFVPAQVISTSNNPSVTGLSFTASNTSVWTPVTLNLTDQQQNVIYTRFIRIGFTRNPAGPPFTTTSIPNLHMAYSVEVRNARIGRNIASSGITGATLGLSPSTPVKALIKPVARFDYTESSES
jgi:hypothetical protein